MANAQRGEVAFEAQGKSYTLRLSVNAICALEDKLNRGFLDIQSELNSWAPPVLADDLGAPILNDKGEPQPALETAVQIATRQGRMRFGVIRAVIWAGLQEFHPAVTPLEAGEIIQAIGGMMPAINLIAQATVKAMPDPTPGDTARP